MGMMTTEPDRSGSPPLTPAIATAVHQAEYLTTLLANVNGDSLIELRLIEDGEARKADRHADFAFCETVEQVLAHLPQSPQRQYGHGAFIGVCPRTKPKGNKASVKAAQWLWVDLDSADVPGGKAEALRRLQAFPLRYTMLIDSGHGYHAYWRLQHPVPTRTEAEGKAFEDYLKRLCVHLRGDWAVCERSRVMRIPGTWNLKDPLNPLPVRLMDLDPTRGYDLTAFDQVLPSLAEQQARVRDNAPGWVTTVLKDLQVGSRDDCHTVFGKVIGKFIESGLGVEDILTLLTPHLAQINHAGHRFSHNDLQEEIEDMVRRYGSKGAASKPQPPGSVYSAQFEGLVDLVEHEGAVAFLVKEGEQLLILPEVERDGQRLIPPPKDQLHWLLPRGEEVLRYYKTDCDVALYDALVAYHQRISGSSGFPVGKMG